jgi:2,4-dienoyl-CoA reductase-like NADH-dependent reductase (Old Yellow Enzyme family)
MSSQYAGIFTPLRIRNLDLRSRVVSPPMYQVRPILSPLGLAWHRRLAAGGAAMVIVEGTSVRRLAGKLSADDLRPLVEAIHEQGAAAAIQLFPAVADEAASPEALSGGQIEALVDQYAKSAVVCRDAGFDAVEPHGAHGFLLNQFFMPDRNRRRDAYGGSLAGRCRLGERIVAAMRAAAGEEITILYRHTPVGAAYGLEDSFVLVERLIEAGLDCLDCSPARDQEVADLAWELKKRFDVPVIAVGQMEKPELAARALREGRCDLVAVGRQLIADAHWPRKVRQGRLDEIVWCTQCDEACFGNIRDGKPAACVLWAEGELEGYVQPPEEPCR